MNLNIPTTSSELTVGHTNTLSSSLTGARLRDFLFGKFILVNAVLAISIIFLIFIYVGKEAIPIFYDAETRKEASLYRLFAPQDYGSPDMPLPFVWQPVGEVPKYSVLPLFLGTLKVTILALLFAAPLAIAAALYTAEFASHRVREIVKPVVELLAGIPSVVLGFLALIVLATWLQDLFGFDYRLNAITAGVAMALAIIPIIYTVSEDALTSVPRTYREASLALGVPPWKTAWSVVLPAATPGIFAALILGFGRAMGETMVVLMASGNAAITSLKLSDSVRTISATIAAELGEVVFQSPHYYVLFFLGAMLFVLTFLLNMLGEYLVGKLKLKLMGR
jgi:phosphate transport system permease protein